MGSGPRQVWPAVPPVRIHMTLGAQDKLEPTVPGQVSLTTCGGHSQERALIAPQRVERSAPLLRHERPASPILVRETRRVDLTGGRCVIAGLSGSVGLSSCCTHADGVRCTVDSVHANEKRYSDPLGAIQTRLGSAATKPVHA